MTMTSPRGSFFGVSFLYPYTILHIHIFSLSVSIYIYMMFILIYNVVTRTHVPCVGEFHRGV